MSVLIETTLGDLVVDLFVKERPNTCKNFLKLCKIKYYNLNQIFTIQTNYIAQTGDPTNNGRGGESVYGLLYGDQARYFENEMIPKMKHSRKGLLSMVNNGNNMLGSQFFITLDDNLDYLNEKHCIFGQVSEGMDVVQKLNEEHVDNDNQPFRDIRISHTIILHDPFEDPKRLPIPRSSPEPSEDLIKQSAKIALDENINEDEGKSKEEIAKEMEEKEMRAQAQILEMVGDLRRADERPPDNVLFVCKLNPVTSDEELEVIFSRFGDIKCCEIIRDRRTGASLQYAFIEFEKPEFCEAAYLKMDNVLIDDRRIHVDFSQSVAKNDNLHWERKGAPANKTPKKPSEKTQTSSSSRKLLESKRSGGARSPVKEENRRRRIPQENSSSQRKEESRKKESSRRRSRSQQRDHRNRRSRSRSKGHQMSHRRRRHSSESHGENRRRKHRRSKSSSPNKHQKSHKIKKSRKN